MIADNIHITQKQCQCIIFNRTRLLGVYVDPIAQMLSRPKHQHCVPHILNECFARDLSIVEASGQTIKRLLKRLLFQQEMLLGRL